MQAVGLITDPRKYVKRGKISHAAAEKLRRLEKSAAPIARYLQQGSGFALYQTRSPRVEKALRSLLPPALAKAKLPGIPVYVGSAYVRPPGRKRFERRANALRGVRATADWVEVRTDKGVTRTIPAGRIPFDAEGHIDRRKLDRILARMKRGFPGRVIMPAFVGPFTARRRWTLTEDESVDEFLSILDADDESTSGSIRALGLAFGGISIAS